MPDPRENPDLVPAAANARTIIRPDRVQATYDQTSVKVSRFFYIDCGDELWEWDGYRVGPVDAPDDAEEVKWTIHLTCPLCHRSLKLDSTLKKMKVYREHGLDVAEPIRCSWPAQFGGLCPWSVSVELATGERAHAQLLLDGGIVKHVCLDAIGKRC